jgi:two-component system, sensor histidine kinase YesM
MMINKFFIKRFRTFFLFMIIPTIIVFIMFVVFMGNRFNSDLKVQGNNSLSGIKTNFGVVIRDAVYQQSLITTNNDMMVSLQKLLINVGNYDESNDGFLRDFEATQRSIIYSHSYIDSVYIYLDGYDDFFSSAQNGVASLDSYYDTDWYKDYRDDTAGHDQWIVKRKINQYSYAPPESVLTVFQRMASRNGVIVININENKLISIINSVVTDKNEYFFMLDNNNSVLLSNQENAGPDISIRNGFFKKYLSEKKVNLPDLSGKWTSIGGKRYLVSASDYPESQINLVSLISDDALFAQFFKFIFDFIFILIGNIGIVFFLSYITTKRIFHQIEYMIQVFGDAEKGLITEPPQEQMMDEYDIIMNNIIHLFLSTNQMNNQLLERQHQLEVAELTALQLQINPHFLLNTLQTMDFEALKLLAGPSTMNIIIHDLSDILKYALGNPMQPVSLREELTYLKEYVNIQKYRFGDKFIVYYEIEEDLLDSRVFRLMLQPLLENSINHGVRRLNKMGYIKLKVRRRGDYLKFRVIDNGVGMERDQITALYKQINDKNSRSIGLTNVNRRLILEYGEDCGLHILSKKDLGLCISFKIPIEKSAIKQKNDTIS